MALGDKVVGDRILTKVRQDLLERIRQQPGITFLGLVREGSRAFGATSYHLTILEKRQMVYSFRSGRARRYYAAGAMHYSMAKGMAVVAAGRAGELLGILRDKGPCTMADLAKEMQVTRQSVAYYLRALLREGLVLGAHDRREAWYRPMRPVLDGPVEGVPA